MLLQKDCLIILLVLASDLSSSLIAEFMLSSHVRTVMMERGYIDNFPRELDLDFIITSRTMKSLRARRGGAVGGGQKLMSTPAVSRSDMLCGDMP
mmetsp:Transcript_16642/g.34115  ORF Transcript_16642/g.34115 Transcript_16642/m.34115 type:complete len:95 (-) Transcript_16642:91-375(-)